MAVAKRQAVHDAVPTRDEIASRVEAMMPMVRELALKGERDRQVADEVIEALRGAESIVPCSPAASAAGNTATRR